MYDDVCYKRNYLSEVIARIDFMIPADALAKAIPAKLSDLISKSFPIFEPADAVNVQVSLNKDGATSDRTPIRQWNFFGREREKQLQLTPNWIFADYKKYKRYSDVKDQFFETVELLGKLFPDLRSQRFGLRYINIIVLEDTTSPAQVRQLLAKELTSTLEFFQGRELTRLFHIAEVKSGELSARFQFGFPNPDYPAIMKRPDFVLDYDCSTQVPHELAESLKHMDDAHEVIQGLFESSISGTLRQKLDE